MKNKIIKTVFLSVICFSLLGERQTEVIAAEKFYERIEQTENKSVMELSEKITSIYPICPELIEALIFYESSNKSDSISEFGDMGYMQVNSLWQKERIKKLGVEDLLNGYSNVLVGTDFLFELFEKYDDPAMVLMSYNMGEDKAKEKYDRGEISDYAIRILDLSEKLERKHGK